MDVKMLVQPEDGKEEHVYKTGTNITLLCMSNPHEDYMNVGNAVVNYTFVVCSPTLCRHIIVIECKVGLL